LWCNAEGIGNAVEEGKHCCYINSFGNLGLGPSEIAQLLHVVWRCAVRGFIEFLCVVEQRSLGSSETSVVKISLRDCRNRLLFGSLDTQEVSVRVQSIRTAVQVGDVAGNRLLGAAIKMSFREMDGIAEIHDLTQEIGPVAEAF